MCTIIFIAKIPLQFQIKPELHLPGPYPGLTGDQNSPYTLCLTRKETLVTASSKEILIGTTNSWILYQRRDIYSICRICWNVAAYWWNTPTLIFSHLYTWQINFYAYSLIHSLLYKSWWLDCTVTLNNYVYCEIIWNGIRLIPPLLYIGI